MKLNILSDLHLSRGTLEIPGNDADVVILAGDIARPKEAAAWALGFAKPVLYVPGNHEFYGGNLVDTVIQLKQLCAGTHVHVLDNDEVVLGGVRFLGTTLLTDFKLFDVREKGATAMQRAQSFIKRAAAVRLARSFMRDFSKIHVDEAAQTPFTPADSAALFARHARWLERKLSEPHAGPTVVITHHAPSPKSIHPRFAGSLMNACFVSDAERLIDGDRARLWVHGHTHDSFNYWLNGTQVVCNPRGYAKDGKNENSLFDPNFVVEIN